MNDIQQRLTTRRMVAQFYMDMAKYFLVLICAFGLFASPQGSITRVVIYISVVAGIFSAAYRAQYNMNRIDEIEQEDDK